MNEFLPIYFYLTLLSFSNYNTLPFLLFAALFISAIVYPFNFIHLLLIIILFILNVSWHHKYNLKYFFLKNFLNTFLYLFILMLINQNINYYLIVSSLIWNSLFTIIIFKQGKLNFSKK